MLRLILHALMFVNCLVIGLFVSGVKAADIFDLGELYFETVSTVEQIPDGIVTALAGDKRGFLWVGTQNGLYRYDGYQFRRLDQIIQNASPLGIFITSLYAAPDGRLWIGTLSDGVSVYSPASGKLNSWAVQSDSQFSLSHNRVDAIVGDKAGNIWIGTNDGLDRIDAKTQHIRRYRHSTGDSHSLNDSHIRALLVDDKDRLWVGSWNGLNRLKQDKSGFESLFSEPQKANSLSQQRVDSLFQSVDGKIWIGTEASGAAWISPTDQFARIEVDPNNKNKLSHAWVHTITQPNETTLWLGTRDGGINVVDAATGQVLRQIRHDPAIDSSLGFDDIGALLVDRSGLLWIGTWGGGLVRHNPANMAFRALRHSPYNDKKLSYADIGSVLALDDGTIWVGTHGNGIDIIKPDIGVVGGIRPDPKTPNALADGTVIALAETPDDLIWIGTQQAGLYRFDRTQKALLQFTLADGLIDPHVRRILPDNKGRLWIGTYGGLNRFDVANETFESFTSQAHPNTIFSETIYTLAQQADGTLWVGTDNGLYRLPSGSKQLLQVQHIPGQADSLSHNNIQGLLIDNENTLWVGTAMGLDKLVRWDDNKPVFDSFSRQVGQHGKPLWGNSLADEQGRIWFGTAMLDPKTLQFHQWDHANGVDMIPWLGSFTKTKQGLLLYGSAKGLLMIKPQKLTPWHYQPLLVVSELKVNGQSALVPPDEVTLAPRTKSFSVEFAALDLSGAQSNRYAYRLEGYDEQWIETDFQHRIASYTNLDPATYTLHIRGSNRLGEWSPHQLALSITQMGAWYQSWWFKLMAFLVIVKAAYLLANGLAKLRLRQLKQQKQALRRQVHEQTQALEIKNKALEEALHNLEKLSLTDQLTGAHNRRFLNKLIEPELSKLRRERANPLLIQKEDLAFIMIDIDLFKQVNDTYGHEAGDRVLIQFIGVLNETCRSSDWVIRWGGEEFLVVGRFLKRQQLHQLGERIRLAVLSHKFDLGEGLFINKTCSIGITAFPFIHHSIDILTWEQTLNLADLALYGAKNNGRNGWVSLFEVNIVDTELFYHQTLDDLQTQVDKGTIGFDTSLDKSHFHF